MQLMIRVFKFRALKAAALRLASNESSFRAAEAQRPGWIVSKGTIFIVRIHSRRAGDLGTRRHDARPGVLNEDDSDDHHPGCTARPGRAAAVTIQNQLLFWYTGPAGACIVLQVGRLRVNALAELERIALIRRFPARPGAHRQPEARPGERGPGGGGL